MPHVMVKHMALVDILLLNYEKRAHKYFYCNYYCRESGHLVPFLDTLDDDF